MQWGWESSSPERLASLRIAAASPVEFLVTDPTGRRSGIDPRGDTSQDEIPEAAYHIESITDDTGEGLPPHPIKTFESFDPLDGYYIVQVFGTGSGSYTLDILGYNEQGEPSSSAISGLAERGSVQTYRLEYSSASGSLVQLVPHTFASLCQLTEQFVGNVGLSRSLCAKLEAAQRAHSSGLFEAKAGAIEAYVNEVNAQRGRALTNDHAAILTMLVAAI